MAYLTFLHSVSEAHVAAFRAARNKSWLLRLGKNKPSLKPSRTTVCSHVIAYWVEIQPLGQLLGEAIDGGELLHPALRHRFRPPLYQDSDAVKKLHSELKEAWNAIETYAPPAEEDDWYTEQISHVLTIFSWAAEHDEAVVTWLPH